MVELFHIEVHLRFQKIARSSKVRPGNTRCMLGMPRNSHWNIIEGRQQSPTWIKTNPASAWQIDFGPPMHRHPARYFRRIHIATDKTGRQPEKAAGFHKKGGEIPA